MTRPETGPMEFEGDWPGVFIRGDEALHDAGWIHEIADLLLKEGVGDGTLTQGISDHLRLYAKTLESCAVVNGKDPKNLTRLRAFEHCNRDNNEEADDGQGPGD